MGEGIWRGSADSEAGRFFFSLHGEAKGATEKLSRIEGEGAEVADRGRYGGGVRPLHF